MKVLNVHSHLERRLDLLNLCPMCMKFTLTLEKHAQPIGFNIVVPKVEARSLKACFPWHFMNYLIVPTSRQTRQVHRCVVQVTYGVHFLSLRRSVTKCGLRALVASPATINQPSEALQCEKNGHHCATCSSHIGWDIHGGVVEQTLHL